MMSESLKRYWWVSVVRSICGIIFGVIAFAYLGLALATLVLLFAARALMISASEIALGFKLRRELRGEWFLMGLISIVFVALLLCNPVAGAPVLIWLTAWYATVFGVLAIIFGIRLRGLRGTPAPL
ncbi:MAG: hypothetical protein DMF43_04035 [Verrucomicrobia bacterium]|nr:MAG: hypothetical protein DMF43_04035 [Verrucomicrobiota bacterium]